MCFKVQWEYIQGYDKSGYKYNMCTYILINQVVEIQKKKRLVKRILVHMSSTFQSFHLSFPPFFLVFKVKAMVDTEANQHKKNHLQAKHS